MKSLILFLSVSLIAFVGSVCGADSDRVRVSLSNGDLVSGKLLSETEDYLEVGTTYAGVVRLEKDIVLHVETLEALPAKKSVEGVDSPATDSTKGIAVVKPVKTEDPVVPKVTRNKYLRPLMFNVLEKWKKRVEFGFTTQSGRRDKSDLAFRYKMQRKVGANQYLTETKILYGKTNDSVSTDRTNSFFRWRHGFAPGVFFESNSSYSSDAIKEIDYIFDQRVGVGYRFIESESIKLSTGLGGTMRLREDLNRENEQEELVDLFQDSEYKLSERVKLSQDMRFAMLLDDGDQYEVEFRASLISSLTKAVNLTVRYEIEYDASLPKDRREDRRMVSSLGYDF